MDLELLREKSRNTSTIRYEERYLAGVRLLLLESRPPRTPPAVRYETDLLVLPRLQLPSHNEDRTACSRLHRSLVRLLRNLVYRPHPPQPPRSRPVARLSRGRTTVRLRAPCGWSRISQPVQPCGARCRGGEASGPAEPPRQNRARDDDRGAKATSGGIGWGGRGAGWRRCLGVPVSLRTGARRSLSPTVG